MAMEKLRLELSSGQGGSSTKWLWIFSPTLPCGVFVFLAPPCRRFLRLHRLLLRRRLLIITSSTTSSHHHHIINKQHTYTINTTPSTQHHEHKTSSHSPSTQHHQHNIMNTTSSNQHHQHNSARFAWEAQRLEHLHRGPRKSGDN